MLRDRILEQLKIDNFHYVEIESKKRVSPRVAEELKDYLWDRKKVRHVKSTLSMDQFLDTPHRDLFNRGVSLRLRYKKSGSEVYLQYKGPGFKQEGLLYRSEFSSGRLKNVTLEESHHDMIHFTKTPIQKIIARALHPDMAKAMRTHLGAGVLEKISVGPILCVYQKEKFKMKLGKAFLEPSLDRVFAFKINDKGLHPLSTFWEFENEIKAEGAAWEPKLEHLPDLLEFDQKLSRKFDLKVEPLDKYHRCTSIFLAK